MTEHKRRIIMVDSIKVSQDSYNRGYNKGCKDERKKAIGEALVIMKDFRKRVKRGAFITYSMLIDQIEKLKEG